METVRQEHTTKNHSPRVARTLPSAPHLMVVGASYRSSRLKFREELLERVEGHLDGALMGTDEYALLSTCNRFELYLVSETPEEAYASLLRSLEELTGTKGVESLLYRFRGIDAVEHLFRVASGLESVVVGEPQILAQVREAGVRSRTSGESGAVLSPLFDRAYRVGGRVREAHGLASEETSLSDLAMEAVNRARPGGHTTLLVGTGKMIRLAARRLKDAEKLYVVSRRKTPPPGLERCTLVRQSALRSVAKKCDVIISATTSRRPLLTPRDLGGRTRRVVVDLGMPRNVSESVRELKNVTLYDLDDLARTATSRPRRRDLRGAEEMVAGEAREFYGWLVQTRFSTTLADLYSWAEAVRLEEMNRTVRKLRLPTRRDRRVVDAMGRRIVSKLLSRPTRFARGGRGGLSAAERLELLRSVFGMDETEDGAGHRRGS